MEFPFLFSRTKKKFHQNVVASSEPESKDAQCTATDAPFTEHFKQHEYVERLYMAKSLLSPIVVEMLDSLLDSESLDGTYIMTKKQYDDALWASRQIQQLDNEMQSRIEELPLNDSGDSEEVAISDCVVVQLIQLYAVLWEIVDTIQDDKNESTLRDSIGVLQAFIEKHAEYRNKLEERRGETEDEYIQDDDSIQRKEEFVAEDTFICNPQGGSPFIYIASSTGKSSYASTISTDGKKDYEEGEVWITKNGQILLPAIYQADQSNFSVSGKSNMTVIVKSMDESDTRDQLIKVGEGEVWVTRDGKVLVPDPDAEVEGYSNIVLLDGEDWMDKSGVVRENRRPPEPKPSAPPKSPSIRSQASSIVKEPSICSEQPIIVPVGGRCKLNLTVTSGDGKVSFKRIVKGDQKIAKICVCAKKGETCTCEDDMYITEELRPDDIGDDVDKYVICIDSTSQLVMEDNHDGCGQGGNCKLHIRKTGRAELRIDKQLMTKDSRKLKDKCTSKSTVCSSVCTLYVTDSERIKTCSSHDINPADSKLNNKNIFHPNPIINDKLNKMGANIIILSCRPAKCCRKAVFQERQRTGLPYAASLRSLPLLVDDINIIHQSYIMSTQKYKRSSQIKDDCETKMAYYTNLVKDDFNQNPTIPWSIPIYEVRYFLIDKQWIKPSKCDIGTSTESSSTNGSSDEEEESRHVRGSSRDDRSSSSVARYRARDYKPYSINRTSQRNRVASSSAFRDRTRASSFGSRYYQEMFPSELCITPEGSYNFLEQYYRPSNIDRYAEIVRKDRIAVVQAARTSRSTPTKGQNASKQSDNIDKSVSIPAGSKLVVVVKCAEDHKNMCEYLVKTDSGRITRHPAEINSVIAQDEDVNLRNLQVKINGKPLDLDLGELDEDSTGKLMICMKSTDDDDRIEIVLQKLDEEGSGSPGTRFPNRNITTHRVKQCSSLDINVDKVDSRLFKKGIRYPRRDIESMLKGIGASNLLRACRPAKCCRKAYFEEPTIKPLPYSASLRSLYLDANDLKIVEESLLMSKQKCKNSLDLKRVRDEKMAYYTNLVRDDFDSNGHFPWILPVYEVRYFEISKLDTEESKEKKNSKHSIMNFLTKPFRRSPENKLKNKSNKHKLENSNAATQVDLDIAKRFGMKEVTVYVGEEAPQEAARTEGKEEKDEDKALGDKSETDEKDEGGEEEEEEGEEEEEEGEEEGVEEEEEEEGEEEGEEGEEEEEEEEEDEDEKGVGEEKEEDKEKDKEAVSEKSDAEEAASGKTEESVAESGDAEEAASGKTEESVAESGDEEEAASGKTGESVTESEGDKDDTTSTGEYADAESGSKDEATSSMETADEGTSTPEHEGLPPIKEEEAVEPSPKKDQEEKPVDEPKKKSQEKPTDKPTEKPEKKPERDPKQSTKSTATEKEPTVPKHEKEVMTDGDKDKDKKKSRKTCKDKSEAERCKKKNCPFSSEKDKRPPRDSGVSQKDAKPPGGCCKICPKCKTCVKCATMPDTRQWTCQTPQEGSSQLTEKEKEETGRDLDKTPGTCYSNDSINTNNEASTSSLSLVKDLDDGSLEQFVTEDGDIIIKKSRSSNISFRVPKDDLKKQRKRERSRCRTCCGMDKSTGHQGSVLSVSRDSDMTNDNADGNCKCSLKSGAPAAQARAPATQKQDKECSPECLSCAESNISDKSKADSQGNEMPTQNYCPTCGGCLRGNSNDTQKNAPPEKMMSSERETSARRVSENRSEAGRNVQKSCVCSICSKIKRDEKMSASTPVLTRRCDCSPSTRDQQRRDSGLNKCLNEMVFAAKNVFKPCATSTERCKCNMKESERRNGSNEICKCGTKKTKLCSLCNKVFSTYWVSPNYLYRPSNLFNISKSIRQQSLPRNPTIFSDGMDSFESFINSKLNDEDNNDLSYNSDNNNSGSHRYNSKSESSVNASQLSSKDSRWNSFSRRKQKFSYKSFENTLRKYVQPPNESVNKTISEIVLNYFAHGIYEQIRLGYYDGLQIQATPLNKSKTNPMFLNSFPKPLVPCYMEYDELSYFERCLDEDLKSECNQKRIRKTNQRLYTNAASSTDNSETCEILTNEIAILTDENFTIYKDEKTDSSSCSNKSVGVNIDFSTKSYVYTATTALSRSSYTNRKSKNSKRSQCGHWLRKHKMLEQRNNLGFKLYSTSACTSTDELELENYITVEETSEVNLLPSEEDLIPSRDLSGISGIPSSCLMEVPVNENVSNLELPEQNIKTVSKYLCTIPNAQPFTMLMSRRNLTKKSKSKTSVNHAIDVDDDCKSDAQSQVTRDTLMATQRMSGSDHRQDFVEYSSEKLLNVTDKFSEDKTEGSTKASKSNRRMSSIRLSVSEEEFERKIDGILNSSSENVKCNETVTSPDSSHFYSSLRTTKTELSNYNTEYISDNDTCQENIISSTHVNNSLKYKERSSHSRNNYKNKTNLEVIVNHAVDDVLTPLQLTLPSRIKTIRSGDRIPLNDLVSGSEKLNLKTCETVWALTRISTSVNGEKILEVIEMSDKAPGYFTLSDSGIVLLDFE